jgi:L-ribulose-5-phosphate 4-epimerase
MALFTTTLNHQAQPISVALHDRHFLRKHGSKAYYGQAGEKK